LIGIFFSIVSQVNADCRFCGCLKW